MKTLKATVVFLIFMTNIYAQQISLSLKHSSRTKIPIRDGKFSNDGKWIGWSEVNDHEVHIKYRESLKQVSILNSDQQGVKSFDFHPNEGIVVIGNYKPAITVWQINPKKRIYTLVGHQNEVNCVRFDPEGKYIASAGHDKVVKIWDYQNEKLLFDLVGHDGFIRSLVYSPNGKNLFSVGQDGKLIIWNTRSGKLIKEVELPGLLHAVASSKNDQLLAIGNDNGDLILIYLDTFELFTVKNAHDNLISSIIISPDNQWIITASWDKKIKIWDVKGNLAHESLVHKDYIFAIDISPDGRHLISTSRDKWAKIWNILMPSQ